MPGTRILDVDGYPQDGEEAAKWARVSEAEADKSEYARILDGISEGPILGLVDGLKSIYLDDTPIQNSDGSYNFSGLHCQLVAGTGTQADLDGFPSTENEIAVGVKVSVAVGPVSRTISTQGLDAIRVNIYNPVFKAIDSATGNEYGCDVQIKIEGSSPNYNGAAWYTFPLSGDGHMTGIFQSKRSVGFRLDLPGDGPWTIKVTRLTADGDSYNLNETWWESYDEIQDVKLAYPWTAVAGLMFNPAKFRNIPRRGYEIYGRIVKVPSNYNPSTRVYTGVWNGTFVDAWTDNPAWVWYDLATNTRYGAGSYLDASQIDKWSLYTIAQYCDAMVNDGKGGTEPRFTCNLYLTSREEAIKVLQQVASIFRGITYWAAGLVVPVQDAPASATALFSNTNVVEGRFTYSGTARKARHTAALVAWNDPTDNYRQQIELVEDQAAIARYGYQPAELTALGCTSRGQARRAGLWLLATEQTETETIQFTAGLEGTGVGVGALIQVKDALRAGNIRAAGRIVSSTSTSVTVDAPFTVEPAKGYRLYYTLPDGSLGSGVITNSAGETSTFTVPSMPTQPGADAQWQLLEVTTETPALYRVVSISEVDGWSYEVTAVLHNPDKYDAVELGLTLGPTTARAGIKFPAPASLTLSESTRILGDRLVQVLAAGWTPSSGATSYRAAMSRDNGQWETMTVSGPSALADVTPGAYRVRVAAVYPQGVSKWSEASMTVGVPTEVPTLVGDAQTTANAAASAAAAAQTSANTANTLLSDISSDGKLTPVEKQQARQEWDAIAAEKAGIDSQADAFAVSRTAYDNAFQALATYLNAGTTWSSGIPSWLADANLGTTTTITGSTFRSNWASLYTQRQALLNAISAKAKALADAAQASANYADALARSSNNVVKNPTSEDANATGVEAAGVVTGNAYTGTKCRRVAADTLGTTLTITANIPCSVGDQVLFQAKGKGSAAGSSQRLTIQWLDSSGASTGTTSGTAITGNTYQSLLVKGTAPANTVAYQLKLENRAAVAGGFVYFDDLYAGRLISGAMLEADAIQTSNYTQDGSGNPTAGARMDISSTALKVAAGNLQVGTRVFTDYWFRLLQALDGSNASGIVLYRGNNDVTTRNGAPLIDRLTIYPLDQDTANGRLWLKLVIQPQAATDNLDAMKYTHLQWWRSDQTSASSPAYENWIPTYDRGYYSATHSSASNAIKLTWFQQATFVCGLLSGNSPNFYLKAAMANCYGESAENWYLPPSSLGTAFTNNGTTKPAALTNATGGGSGSGGGGIGGGCPAPWVKIQLASGLLVDAGDLYDGAQVVGVDDITLEPAIGTVREPRVIFRQRVAVVLEDGRAPEFSDRHRFAVVGRGWVEARDLKAGDIIAAQEPAIVCQVIAKGLGQVVTFQVDGCHTYMADGLCSHNIKDPF